MPRSGFFVLPHSPPRQVFSGVRSPGQGSPRSAGSTRLLNGTLPHLTVIRYTQHILFQVNRIYLNSLRVSVLRAAARPAAGGFPPPCCTPVNQVAELAEVRDLNRVAAGRGGPTATSRRGGNGDKPKMPGCLRGPLSARAALVRGRRFG